jgi:hypothetical protein
MRLKLGLITFLFVCFVVGSSAFAEEFKKKCVGIWHLASNWNEGTIPSGTIETKIRYAGTICILNSVENWASTSVNEMRVYNSGILIIVPGASLTGPGWFRVGDGDTGTVNQQGGALILKEGPSTSKLSIGYNPNSNGLYNMTGGTITYTTGDGQLVIGDRSASSSGTGGPGTFKVSGTAPVIQMKSLYVGGLLSGKPAVGTLQYVIGASGVSPIHCTQHINLDLGGASSTAKLVVNCSATPTNSSIPIVLVENQGSELVSGSFDTVMDDSLSPVPAVEGANVILGCNPYTLTYMYDSVSKKVGSARSAQYNDIALIPKLSITILTPNDTSVGDLLIAAVATDGDTSASITAPENQGWTLIDCGAYNSAVTLAAWWKLAEASEPATHTFTWTGAAEQAYGWMMRFTGQAPGNPINAHFTYGESSSAPTSPTVKTTVSNCLILRLGAFDNNSITVDNPGLSGHTAITMNKSTGTASCGMVSGGAGYVKQLTAGNSGTSTFALGSSNGAQMLTIAIAPDSTGGESEIRP